VKPNTEKLYRLIYDQPYEYDDDSPSGYGDHGIEYSRTKYDFNALNDLLARDYATRWLQEGGLDFGVHYGSSSEGHYPRRFVSLMEIVPEVVREVSLK
jgi:hypothetical protein